MSPVCWWIKAFRCLAFRSRRHYLAPADFGSADVAVSLIEITGLFLSLGLGETLLRFASTATSETERNRVASELLGTALAAAVVFGGALQLCVPALVSALSITVDISTVRCGLAGATVTAFIDIPLMWLRLHQRAGAIFAFATLRSVTQIGAMWLVFALGYGVNGLLIANALLVIAFAAFLSGLHIRAHGAVLSFKGAERAALYGAPIVFAGFSTFAVGSLSRWFLSGSVANAEIAYLALAIKLALATAIALQPFTLWWIARRIAILKEPEGLRRSASAWGLGTTILISGAVAINLLAPLFIEAVFPASYRPAMALLPAAVLVCVLNELCTLSNVGSHLRPTAFTVMGINMSGAAAAITGYALLIPLFGVRGALYAMMMGHGVRLVLFLFDGRKITPNSVSGLAGSQPRRRRGPLGYPGTGCQRILAPAWMDGDVIMSARRVRCCLAAHQTLNHELVSDD